MWGENRLVSQFSTKITAVMPGNAMTDEVLPMLGLIAVNYPFTNHMTFLYGNCYGVMYLKSALRGSCD